MMFRLLLAAAVAIAAPTLHAAPMTLEQVAQMRHVTEVAVAPGGGRVAYRLSVPRVPFAEDDGASWHELHVADARGNTRGYVVGQVSIRQPQWFPDGQAIAFLDRRTGDEHIALYSIPVAGGEARRIVKLDTAIDAYAISRDGRRVALLAREQEPAESRELRRKGFSQKVHEEDWLHTRVWIAEIGGDAEPRLLPVEGTVHNVRWSPDGRRLALAIAPTPSVDDSLVFTRVRIVDATSGEIQVRIDNPGKLGPFEWSPDGAHLAMIAAESELDPREGRLMVADTRTGRVVEALPGLMGHVWSMDWLDAQSLVFVSMEGVEARVGTVRRDGRNARTVLRAGGPIFTQVSAARNGDVALVGSTPSHGAEAFLLSRGANEARRLTDSNPWLADVRFGRQEVVRYDARDGLMIEGLLILPVDHRQGERYPLIVQVHGGPEAHYSNGWLTHYNLPGQVAAGRGYAVFYPNYRASTGRGVEFTITNHYDPAGKEFDDIVDGVDYLIERGLVDRDRVGVTGGSYGGYATAWMSTYYSERFAAGVMSVGISDATMMMALGDIPWEMYLVHLRVWPWENWELYDQRSPLRHVENARTPLLIMHGEADTRVHVAHSLALYRLLRLKGNAPVRLVLYPGEGHGNQRAASRYDFSVRLMRWFDHYLKGEGGDPPPYPVDYSAIRGDADDE